MKLNTVNIITCVNESVQGITSFTENRKGNKEAEKLFVNLIKENYPETSQENIDASLDNGYFEEDS